MFLPVISPSLLHVLLVVSAPPGANWERIFSGVVALSTLVYAVLTSRLVTETSKMRHVQSDPQIGISVVQSKDAFGFADMLIRNDGAGPAVDVRFEIVKTDTGDPDPQVLASLESLGLMQTGIPYMSPGGEFRTYIAQILGRSDAAMQTDRKSTRLNSSHIPLSRMPSSA